MGRYRALVLDAGRALPIRLVTERPDRRIEGRVLAADDLVGHVREPRERALVMAVAWYEGDRGRMRTAGIALDWETSHVITVE